MEKKLLIAVKMRKLLIINAFFFILTSIIYCFSAKVVKIYDSDTIVVVPLSNNIENPEYYFANRINIKLYGIDCPETNQRFGKESKKFISKKILNKEIEVEGFNYNWHNELISLVYIIEKTVLSEKEYVIRDAIRIDGIWISNKSSEVRVTNITIYTDFAKAFKELAKSPYLLNTLLLRKGLAWIDPKYEDDPIISEWTNLQKIARKKKIGLWNQENPIPPWQWRKMKKRSNRHD